MPRVREEGHGPRRLAALALQGVRADVLRQDDVAAGLLQAQARGVAGLRVRHAVGAIPQGLRRALRDVAQDLVVHAHAPLRGDGARRPAVQDGGVRLAAGGRHLC